MSNVAEKIEGKKISDKKSPERKISDKKSPERKISDEKLQAKIGFAPHKAQREILNSQARDKFIVCGRRFGKTLIAAYEVVKESLQPNRVIFIVAPTYYLTNKTMDYVLQFLAKITDKFKYSSKPFPRIELGNGSVIEGKSADSPQGILGSSTDLNIIDEAALLSDDIWFRYIKPTTIDRQGRTIAISTPNGQNWLYDLWLGAQKSGKKRAQFQYSSYDNPHLSREYLEEQKRTMPERVFQQEIMADFMTNAGAVFGDVNKLVDGGMEEYNENHSYTMGADLAKHHDFTAMVVMDNTTKKVVWAERHQKEDWDVTKERVIVLARKYKALTYIDSSGIGDSVVEDIKRHYPVIGYSMHSYKKKQQLIEKLQIYCEAGIIRLCDDPQLILELKQYQYRKLDSGFWRYAAPKGKTDDMVMALALAVQGLTPDTPPDPQPRKVKYFNDYL